MKKLLLIFTLTLIVQFLSAQHCGNSGSFQCTPNPPLANGTFTSGDEIQCVVRGQLTDINFRFQAIGDISTSRWNRKKVENMTFDSILNIPDGLCWSTDDTNDSIGFAEELCFRLSGITYVPAGQYNLSLKAHYTYSWMGSPWSVRDTVFAYRVSIRVIDSVTSLCPPVTNAQATGYQPYTNNYQGSVEISGKLFFDVNENHVFDNGEYALSNEMVTIGNTG